MPKPKPVTLEQIARKRYRHMLSFKKLIKPELIQSILTTLPKDNLSKEAWRQSEAYSQLKQAMLALVDFTIAEAQLRAKEAGKELEELDVDKFSGIAHGLLTVYMAPKWQSLSEVEVQKLYELCALIMDDAQNYMQSDDSGLPWYFIFVPKPIVQLIMHHSQSEYSEWSKIIRAFAPMQNIIKEKMPAPQWSEDAAQSSLAVASERLQHALAIYSQGNKTMAYEHFKVFLAAMQQETEGRLQRIQANPDMPEINEGTQKAIFKRVFREVCGAIDLDAQTSENLLNLYPINLEMRVL